MLVTVGNHSLKLGAAIRGAALGAVDVLSNDSISIIWREFIASFDLALNGLLSRRVRISSPHTFMAAHHVGFVIII